MLCGVCQVSWDLNDARPLLSEGLAEQRALHAEDLGAQQGRLELFQGDHRDGFDLEHSAAAHSKILGYDRKCLRVRDVSFYAPGWCAIAMWKLHE